MAAQRKGNGYSDFFEQFVGELFDELACNTDKEPPVGSGFSEYLATTPDIVNYRVALDTAIGQLEQIPLSLRLIRDAHRILMRGVRGHEVHSALLHYERYRSGPHRD